MFGTVLDMLEVFRQTILTNHVAGFLFSLRVARIKSPSGIWALIGYNLAHVVMI